IALPPPRIIFYTLRSTHLITDPTTHINTISPTTTPAPVQNTPKCPRISSIGPSPPDLRISKYVTIPAPIATASPPNAHSANRGILGSSRANPYSAHNGYSRKYRYAFDFSTALRLSPSVPSKHRRSVKPSCAVHSSNTGGGMSLKYFSSPTR